MEIRRKKDGENLKDLEGELADLLFTIICIANDQNISLTEAYERKLKKIYSKIIIVLRENNSCCTSSIRASIMNLYLS